jgi:hypothetical protein
MDESNIKEAKDIIRFIKKLKHVHPVVEAIARNLAEIDVIQYVTILEDFIRASSEITAGHNKIPITKEIRNGKPSMAVSLNQSSFQWQRLC